MRGRLICDPRHAMHTLAAGVPGDVSRPLFPDRQYRSRGRRSFTVLTRELPPARQHALGAARWH